MNHRNRGKDPLRGGREPLPHEIASARESAGLTQQQAAELIYVSPRTWQDWEGNVARMRAGAWLLFLISIGLKDQSEQRARYRAALTGDSQRPQERRAGSYR